jgi:hypothetical protein
VNRGKTVGHFGANGKCAMGITHDKRLVGIHIAALLAEELGQNAAWQARQVEQFAKVAAGYLVI